MISVTMKLKLLMNQVRFSGSARSLSTCCIRLQTHHCHRATLISSKFCNSTAQTLSFKQRNQFSTNDNTRDVVIDDRDVRSDELLKTRWSGQIETDDNREVIIDDRDVRSDELLKTRWYGQKVETDEIKEKKI